MSRILTIAEADLGTTLSVVFIHGLAGDPQHTWQSGDESTFWPAWLAADVERIAIYSVGYEAAASGWTGLTMPIHDRAGEVLELLRAKGILDRPTVFVTHSLGGLVVKQMARLAHTQGVAAWNEIKSNLAGVVFIATPHTGSDLPNYLRALKTLFRLSHTIEELKRNAAQLRDLNVWFRNNAEQLKIDCHAFYEMLNTKGVRVVDEDSADPGIRAITVLPVLSDHLSIAKPRSREEMLYLSTVRFLKSVQKRLQAPQPGASQVPAGSERGAATELPGSEIEDVLRVHKAATARRIAQIGWWDRPIPLSLRVRGETLDARTFLERWLSARAPSHGVLIGPPGSGKSGLVWWAASVISRRSQALPLIVPAQRLRGVGRIDLGAVLEAAKPAIDETFAAPLAATGNLFLLLDGLDELSGIDIAGETVASAIIKQVMAAMPDGTRVLASCRTVAFGALRGTLEAALKPDVATEESFVAALENTFGCPGDLEIMEVEPVNMKPALAYLAPAADEETLARIAGDKRWIPLLASPNLLNLYKEILPGVAPGRSFEMDRLFAGYVRHALLQSNPGIAEDGLSRAIDALKRRANFLSTDREGQDLSAAVAAGIVTQEDGNVEWHHYTLWEYFFACALYDEITAFNSSSLARVDLIGGYNINRFLVPMLNRAAAAPSHGVVTRVSPTSYLEFTEKTGWRRASGYGLHPSRAASGQTVVPATFHYDAREADTIHRNLDYGLEDSDVACKLSWYDAAAYALFTGARLPLSAELASARPRGDYLFWCRDWRDEMSAHIFAYDGASGEPAGMNPDVRLARTALLVIR